ncbi:MAG: hypothetical protein PHY57_03045 [Ignavibacterium sp.]|nr:hypothetical protein [Ignavibacterium sp.]
MKNLIFVIVLFATFFISCSEPENPITPTDPGITTPFYLGKIGTQRTYDEIVKWFVPNTDSPFIYVPDSLKNVIQLTEDELSQGIVTKSIIVQRIDSIDYSYYAHWNLPYPYEEYKSLEGNSDGYDLSAHIRAISEGSEYYGSHSGISLGRYIETEDSITAIIYPYGIGRELFKPLRNGLEWIRQELEYIDIYDGKLKTHNISAKVIGEVDVTVKAGSFKAYKIQIDYNWPDLNYTVLAKYEYYVPNIGLVLEEWDRVDHIAYLYLGGNNTIIVVRTVGRNELVSYNIIN